MDDALHQPESDESAHTTSRKSARSPRVEIITRGERRRSWTLEQKREIVAESLGPELTPTEVARKHGISSGLALYLAAAVAGRADRASSTRTGAAVCRRWSWRALAGRHPTRCREPC